MPRWHIGVFRGRRGAPQAVQEALFEIELRPERRYYRQILQALASALVDGDQLRAEVAVSRVLGVIWASDPTRDGGAEEAFGRGLVDYIRQQHSQPVGANLLRVLAVTATVREVREAAAAALAVRPWPTAPWDPAVGDVQVGRCWVAEDAFGDHATVLCEFGYGSLQRDGRHGLAVHIDRIAQGAAVDIMLVDDVDAAELELRLGADHAQDEFRRVEPGWAGAVLQQALARTDLLPDTPVASGFAPLRALALSRVRSLPVSTIELINGPEPSPGQREAIIAEFVRSPEAAALSAVDPVRVSHLAGLLVEFAARIDPSDLLRVSPGRVEAFLFDWLPAALRSTVGVAPSDVAAVVRAWSAWASRQGGTPLLTRDALARAVEQILGDYLRPRERP